MEAHDIRNNINMDSNTQICPKTDDDIYTDIEIDAYAYTTFGMDDDI